MKYLVINLERYERPAHWKLQNIAKGKNFKTFLSKWKYILSVD